MTAGREPRVAVISDTVDETNGVAIGLRRLVAAASRAGHRMTLIGAERAPHHGDPLAGDSVHRIPAALRAELPFYREYSWAVPELPALIDYLARDADLVQISTPGPMGVAGLIAARMLGLPLIAQYHTEVAHYAAAMTGMPMIGALVEPFVGWCYRQAELCLAPSRAVCERLIGLGVAGDRVVRIPRGVDLSLFDPAKRDRSALARFELGSGPVALYVGRLSVEKNLDGLLAAWAAVYATRPTARLLVVGDGPRAASCRAPGVVCSGPLYGDELACVFASCDVFAFASQTETFGNVVVEAAASGLPVVAMTGGAACEHVVAGDNGLVADHRDGFACALGRLLDDDALRTRMAGGARAVARRYDLDDAMRATWDLYRTIAARRPASGRAA